MANGKSFRASMTTQMSLRLDLSQDTPQVFRPNDLVDGHVTIQTSQSILVSKIAIELHFVSLIQDCSQYGILNEYHNLSPTMSVVYSIETQSLKGPVLPGVHRWPFQFKLPDRAAHLPPSFNLVSRGQEKVLYDTLDVKPNSRINYVINARISGPGYEPMNKEITIVFWPYQQGTDGGDPMILSRQQQLQIPLIQIAPLETNKTSLLKSAGKKYLQKERFQETEMKVLLPWYAVIGQPLQISVSVDSSPELPNEHPPILIKGLRFRLLAVTRAGRARNYSCVLPVMDRRFEHLNIPFPRYDDPVRLDGVSSDLLKVTPAMISKTYDNQARLEDPGVLCPSFETVLIERTYRFSFCMTLNCRGKLQVKAFQPYEIVILPPKRETGVADSVTQGLLGDTANNGNAGAGESATAKETAPPSYQALYGAN